jgi:hypothetical protein
LYEHVVEKHSQLHVSSKHKNHERKNLLVLSSIFLIAVMNVQAQSVSLKKRYCCKKEIPGKSSTYAAFWCRSFQALKHNNNKMVGMAGFFINSRGTTFMIDPLLEGYDMPLLMDFPIMPKEVPHVDAIFATHSDNDHYSVETFNDLKPVTTAYYSTIYVDSLMKK